MSELLQWREYEGQVYRDFKARYPDSEILFDQRIPGRYSCSPRQVDILVNARVAGVDLLGAFDCKHFQNNVDVAVIDGMVGFLDDVDAQFGGVISSEGFSAAAANRAKGASPRIDVRVVPFTSVEDLVSKLGPRSGLMYGNGHAFSFDEPPGWVLDNKSGVREGLLAVLYLNGSSWSTAPAVMYIRTDRREPGDALEAYIERDCASARTQRPSTEVRSAPRIVGVGPSIEATGRRTAEVRQFSGSSSETVAYLEEDAVFITFVLAARTKASHDAAMPAFLILVESYSFFTNHVRVGK